MGSFLRASITDDNFIRGAARLLVADPAVTSFPAKISDVIQIAATTTNEVQTLTTTGTPTAGTFRLGFRGALSGTIPFNATSAQVQSALIAMPTIGTGNVTCGGGPLPTGVTITFTGVLAGQNIESLTVENNLLTGGTTPTAVIAVTTQGAGQYDALTGWTDLGATKTGVQIVRNNAEETFDVDQIYGDIASEPTSWEMNVGTALAEMTMETLDLAWEAGVNTLTYPASEPPEKHLTIGMPTTYIKRRLAVLHQRANGKIRMYAFRLVQRMPQETTITHAKTGEQVTIPVRFRCLADSTVADPLARFGEIVDQQ